MKYLSALLTQASGSIGGATASSNRGGNYFRARVAPVQPRSEAQQAVRARLSALSSKWRTLTPSQIAGWNSLASTVTLHDALGNSYKPTGAQLFTGNNCNLDDVGQPAIEDAPASAPTLPDITPVTAVGGAAPTTLQVSVGLTAAPTGNSFLIKATPQLSPGVSYIGQSRFRILQFFNATDYNTLDCSEAYETLFGDIVLGSSISVSVEMVNLATGFKGIAASTFVIYQ